MLHAVRILIVIAALVLSWLVMCGVKKLIILKGYPRIKKEYIGFVWLLLAVIIHFLILVPTILVPAINSNADKIASDIVQSYQDDDAETLRTHQKYHGQKFGLFSELNKSKVLSDKNLVTAAGINLNSEPYFVSHRELRSYATGSLRDTPVSWHTYVYKSGYNYLVVQIYTESINPQFGILNTKIGSYDDIKNIMLSTHGNKQRLGDIIMD